MSRAATARPAPSVPSRASHGASYSAIVSMRPVLGFTPYAAPLSNLCMANEPELLDSITVGRVGCQWPLPPWSLLVGSCSHQSTERVSDSANPGGSASSVMFTNGAASPKPPQPAWATRSAGMVAQQGAYATATER